MGNVSIGSLTVSIGADTSGIDRSLKKNQQQLKKWSAASKAAISIAVALATRKIIEYSDAFTSLNNKLKVATNSTAELEKVTEALFKISNDTRSSVESTAELYAKLERSTRGLNISQERLLRITESVNKSFAIGGASTQEAAGAIRQLGQALASGTLRGDEFNSIAEQAPIIMEAIKKATGKTAGELRKLAADGTITAEILIESLERYEDEIDGDFAKATATYGQKLEVASNNAIKFVGQNEKLNQSISTLGDTVVFLSENLDTLLTVGKSVSLIYGGILVSSLVKSTNEKFRSIKATEMLALAEAKAAKAAFAASSLVTAKKLSDSKKIASAAVTEARTSLVLLNANKAAAVQALINAKATDRVTTALVFQLQSELARAKAITVAIGDATIQTAVETQLAAAKTSSAAASKALAAAETGASLAAKNATAAKVAASVVTKELTVAKNASAIASQRVSVANALMTASIVKTTIAMRVLTGAARLASSAMAFLGGPVGVLFTVVASLALFVDWETKSEKQTKLTNKAIDDQIESLKGLTKAQLEAQNQKFEQQSRKIATRIKEQIKAIKELEQRQSEASRSTKEFGSGFAFLGGQVDSAKEKLQQLFAEQEKLQQLGSKIFDLKLKISIDEAATEEELIKLEKIKTAKEIEAAKNKAKREADRIAEEKQRRQDEADEILLDFEKRFASEKELQAIFNQEDKDRLAIAFAEKMTSKEEQNQILEQLEKDHQKTLRDIEIAENEAKRQIFERNASSLLNSLKIIGGKSVKIQRAIALAQAGISIATGIARAQELGFPANIAEMVRVAAVGVSAIRSIKSAKIGSAGSVPSGGGSSGSVSGGGGSTPAQSTSQQPASRITVNFVGEGKLSPEAVRELIEQINEAVGDGANLEID